jgi:hypothetical protein
VRKTWLVAQRSIVYRSLAGLDQCRRSLSPGSGADDPVGDVLGVAVGRTSTSLAVKSVSGADDDAQSSTVRGPVASIGRCNGRS